MEHLPKGVLTDEAGYPFTGLVPPQWLDGVDSFFAGRKFKVYGTPLYRTTANLCRRIGDHDLYATWMKNALTSNPSPWWCAAFSTSLLVGYFSTGKSLLDAGSVALNILFNLSLSNKEQDFSKGKFWKALETADATAHATFVAHRAFIDRAIKWRDVAVHRIPPRVRVLTNGPPTKTPEETTMKDVNMGLPENPDVDPVLLPPGAPTIKWINPLDLVSDFSSGFHKFAADVAETIVKSSAAEAHLA